MEIELFPFQQVAASQMADRFIAYHADPIPFGRGAKRRDVPFYQALSTSFAGTQEYMAMEKLGQLRAQADREGQWDLIVVDTPPSRSALDFLDAPNRLGLFLDGRFIRLISAPARASGRVYLKVLGAGIGMASTVLTKVLGGQMLSDVQTFVAALDSMFGGFRDRADLTYGLLKDRGTAFVVVATPERDALREAAFFVERLAADDMPLAGVVVNRLQGLAVPELTSGRALAGAELIGIPEDGAQGAGSRGEAGTPSTGSSEVESGSAGPTDAADALAIGLLTVHATLAELAERQGRVTSAFSAGHPGVPLVRIPALSHDVHDLESLREVGQALASSSQAPATPQPRTT